MKPLRYDEPTDLANALPFRLIADLTVNTENETPEANWHEDIELEFIEDGEGRFLADFDNHRIEKGCIAVANSDVIHHTGTYSTLRYSCILIDNRFARQVGINPSELELRTVIESDTLWAHYKLLRSLLDSEDTPFKRAMLYRIILDILIELRANHTLSVREYAVDAKSISLVKRAIRHIRECYAGRLTLDGIAKAALTDKYTLSREFKRATGLTVVQYINKYRCKCARTLISEGSSVYEAARACGFMSLSFFSRTYKRYMGHVPSESRSEQRTVNSGQ